MRQLAIVAVLGLSGVGKTTLIKEACKQIDGVLHVQASALIKADCADPSVTSEALRTCSGDQVLANQKILVAMFARAVAETDAKVVIFDGHLIIDTDAEVIEIPPDVIAALRPSVLVHVEAAPEVIAERRRADESRKRPRRSVDVLARQQARSGELCQLYASELGVETLAVVPDLAASLSILIEHLSELDKEPGQVIGLLT